VARFYIENFGCRATQADGAALERQFLARGLERAVAAGEAEIVVLNTCTVTEGADKDARASIRRLQRTNPDCRILVTGCYAQRAPQELAALPGATARTRALPLRWLYPDAFFHFQETGQLTFALNGRDFRHNETKPQVTNIGLLLTTDGSIGPGGVKIGLATPDHAEAVADVTDAKGTISSDGANAYAALATGSALGRYVVSVTAADNPTLTKNGALALAPIANLAVVMEYSFTPRGSGL